uniref:melanoma-associated antigen B10-like n=1 Tax=Jaculus jaculus TaxID=51337 RepID=UPI0003330FC7|nr:melanoma-associated antigen B10-like [Jaculus jaculus]
MHQVQTSKHRAQEESFQACQESKDLVAVHATVSQEADCPFSPFDQLKDVFCGSLPKIHSNSDSSRAESASDTRSNKRIVKKVKKKTESAQDQKATENSTKLGDDTVMLLVHYLLYKYKKRETVITQSELLRNIDQIEKKHFTKTLKKVCDYLEFSFGLDLKVVGPSKRIYELKSKLTSRYESEVNDETQIPCTNLIMTILGFIFMSDNCAAEKQVWEMLNKMGLYDGEEHYIFGDIRKLITEDLVEKGYLDYRWVLNSDPPLYEFLWGPRAHAETSKMKVLEFFAKHNNTTPLAYPSYYKEALKDEEERSRARIKARASIAMAKARSRGKYKSCSHFCKI